MPWAGVQLPPDFGQFPEDLKLLAFADLLTAKSHFIHTRHCARCNEGALGRWQLTALPASECGGSMKGGTSSAYSRLGGAGICCHQESKMPSRAELVCIFPCSPSPVRQQLLPTSAQLLHSSRFMLCPEFPSHAAGTAVGSTEGSL